MTAREIETVECKAADKLRMQSPSIVLGRLPDIPMWFLVPALAEENGPETEEHTVSRMPYPGSILMQS